MKDEEMAEEYADKNVCGHCKQCNGAYIGCDKYRYAKQSFLAGLKAGRPQWHDLRENPNDLPERMGLGSKEVYVAYKDGVTDFAYYRFDKKCWERSENEELAENVIAWCEIPTFDKE